MQRKTAELLIAAFFLLLSALTAWQSYQLPPPMGYSSVGPRFFPGVIAAGLLICGLVLLWQALHGGFVDAVHEAEGEPANKAAFFWIVFSLVAFVLTAQIGGFPIAGMLLFAFGARGFGSQQFGKDLIIGFVIALLAYLFFARVLSVQLPSGVLGHLGL
jgi:putative tricarboxylic transport membrane protein